MPYRNQGSKHPITPRILIPIPTTADADYNQRSWPNYAHAVQLAGGEPVELPLTVTEAERGQLLHSCSGILLPGSPADVDPTRYGHERDPETAPADPAREATDWALLEEAEARRIPLLAICFGTQALNVYRGGTLVQHLPGVPVNHGAGAHVAVAHSARIDPESRLGSLVEPSELTGAHRLPVNSNHHQAVGIPGTGLHVVARSSEDDVVEAVEPVEQGGPFLLGVQWHPERSVEISATSRALFQAFVAAAKARAAEDDLA